MGKSLGNSNGEKRLLYLGTASLLSRQKLVVQTEAAAAFNEPNSRPVKTPPPRIKISSPVL